MVEHILGKNEIQVQFLVGAPVDTQTKRLYNSSMYKIIDQEQDFEDLETAMAFAKELNKFVTIKGPDFEICGMFGVDTVANGLCPDGVKYDWNKASRIGATRRR